MFIHDLNIGWMAHDFVRPRFMLKREEDLEKIQLSGVESVYIDTLKGLDLAGAPSLAEAQEAVFKELAARAVAAPRGESRATPWREEATLARQVRDTASRTLQGVLEDVRLGRSLRVEEARPVVQALAESVLRHRGALVSLCRLKERDTYTFEHSVSVSALLLLFGNALGMPETQLLHLGLGGLLHDTGKMTIPDEILNKPGRLTDDEYDRMKDHVASGARILRSTPGVHETAILVASQHHERFEGSGYPASLQGSQISHLGRMAAIADVYDALTSHRVYHAGMTPPLALARIFEWSHQHFDQLLVQRFVQALGIYPTGSLVRLESEHLAVVMDQGETSLVSPLVRIFYDLRRGTTITPRDLDLAAPESGGDLILGWEDPAEWEVEPLDVLVA